MAEAGLAYNFLKFVHVVAVIVLAGNFIGLALWKLLADRSGKVASMAFVTDLLHRMDGAPTAFAGLATFAFGYVGVRGFGNTIANTPFALWGLILMTVAGLIWYFGMRPLEAKMADLAEDAVERNEKVGRDYWRASGLWLTLDLVVIGLILVITWLMIAKPDIWPYTY
ncbi:MAG TPA: DUF2269 family protein [Candidatus Thermoplasmatota archaeon]|nr:DUF2269 family protein [Candidatus Thermoplasmatota archaeon]